MNQQPQQQPVNNQNNMQQMEREKIYQWIQELANIDTKENALLELRLIHVMHSSKIFVRNFLVVTKTQLPNAIRQHCTTSSITLVCTYFVPVLIQA